MGYFVILSLSASESSVSRKCLPSLRKEIEKNQCTHDTVDLRDLPPFWMSDKGLDEAPKEYHELSEKLSRCDGVFILAPIYCYSANSGTKLITELFIKELYRKPVAFITAAGSIRSHLAVGGLTQGMVFEQESFCFPKTIQVVKKDIEEDGSLTPKMQERVSELVREFTLFSITIKNFNVNSKIYDPKRVFPPLEQIEWKTKIRNMKIFHFNVITRNLEKSLKFYQKVLDVKYVRSLGKNKVVTDFNGFEFFIEEVSDFMIHPNMHLGIRTDQEGVVAFAKHLKYLGIPTVKGNNPVDGPYFWIDGHRAALYFEDPDGMLIEVYSPEKLTLDTAESMRKSMAESI